QGPGGTWRRAYESLHALPGLEHRLRQYASHIGTGTPAGAILAIQFPALKIQQGIEFQLPVPAMAGHDGGRVCGMMDFLLEAWVSTIVESAKVGWMLGKGKRWRPGEKLKLLFAGYNGTRNTGSDARVEEMLRQIRHILGANNVQFSVMSQNFKMSSGYFADTRQVHLPDIFPPFLADEVPRHDGVVACEGSMFKSKFANALTTMMIGSLGLAAVQNKLSVGYGAEAGQMDPMIARMCSRFCHQSLVITRNVESRTLLRELGVPTELGTDTAWTFEPHPAEYGQKTLRTVGWDGKTPVLVVCPINPFEWPVKASVAKFAAHSLAG